jgi:hypothetical protein
VFHYLWPFEMCQSAPRHPVHWHVCGHAQQPTHFSPAAFIFTLSSAAMTAETLRAPATNFVVTLN